MLTIALSSGRVILSFCAACFRLPRDKRSALATRVRGMTMSVTTLLLALLPAVVQPRREKTKREVELEIDLADARRDLAEAEARIGWLEAELERQNHATYDALAERHSAWRRLHEANAMAGLAITPAQQAGLAQQQYYAQMQSQAAQQQLAMQNAMAHGQGAMLGAQSLANSDLRCNCVPARHDLLLGLGG